jgi:putative oxidoreductase
MLVAYITAHREELFSVLSEKSTFTEAEPFLYLISAIIIFLFGAGRFSLDYIILRVKMK